MSSEKIPNEKSALYKQTFLTLANKPKKDFIREYKKYDERIAERIYIQVLTELTNAVSGGNAKKIGKLSNLIEYIADVKSEVTLRDYYNNENNPIRNTNLVILACKNDKIEILKSIFDSNKKVLDCLSINLGKDRIAPNDKDEAHFDAFYYAIRSSNVKLLDTLIHQWPNDYFISRSKELDEVLSTAYEELKLRNVSLSEEMEVYVENKLINLRFFANSYRQVKNSADGLNKIIERVDLVLENIHSLRAEYSNEKRVDKKFLFTAKFIAQNIHVLKQQLRSTYNVLPWEEVEFCLICFVSCHIKLEEINLIYRSTLDKSRLLYHLENFSKKLEDEKGIVQNMGIGQLATLPKVRREIVVAEIISNCPQFEELYKDYQQIRDIYSLEKIYDYIKLALSANPKERQGQLIITRALQVFGEDFKNTLESPKLSTTTNELLLLSLPKGTRHIIIDLRNSLSHAYSLSKRTKIEENKDVSFFVGVQNDIKIVGSVITDILYNNKLKTVRTLLKKIVSSESVDEIQGVCKILESVELKNMILGNFKIQNHEKIEKLIKDLSDNIAYKTSYEEKIFNKMNNIINRKGDQSENVKTDYLIAIGMLKALSRDRGQLCFEPYVIKQVKSQANQTLKNITSKIEHVTFKEIAELSINIYQHVKFKDCDPSTFGQKEIINLNEIERIICEILFIAEFETGDIKYIEKLRGKLTENGYFLPEYKQRRINNFTADEYNKRLTLKLTELKGILSNNFLSGELVETFALYKKDKKLQAVVDMLVLDIMSILGSSYKSLENNLLFLDDNTPLLNGKCLRNFLAHDNALVDILLSDPLVTVILNAKKLAEENIVKSRKKIGKFVNNDPSKLKKKFQQDLATITSHERMYNALEEGNLEALKECLKIGADINSRNIDSWTAAHFAAKGSGLEVIKFLRDQNLNFQVKDTNGRNPLHVAAASGSKDVVQFLVKEAGLCIDDLDNNDKTPLHIAAENGCKGAVEVLLEMGANICNRALYRLSPLQLAITNNHIEVAKILLAKYENVDINEIANRCTPLHAAAEFGNLELVNLLLQRNADIAARDDREWTPLHAAARNGHLEIVKALILKGSDVNARVADGLTSLYLAVERGHERIASVLLKHGANVNAFDKTYFFTPLHIAAKSGYEQIVKVLLKNKANAGLDTANGSTPLHLAAQSGHLAIVTALLEHGVNIHAKDINRSTTFHHGVESGDKEVVNLLIKHGAEVNVKGHNNSTPLHLAAIKGYQAIADLLIKNEAKVDSKDIDGNTPLHMAAMKDFVDVCDLLIKSKAEVNARNNNGITPLHAAALSGCLGTIDFLMKNKAKVNTSDKYGRTPLYSAAQNGHKNAVTFLIKNGAHVDVRDFNERTPLHAALEEGHKEIIEILSANGANINAKNSDNLTPLLCAIKQNHKEIVEVLITRGADVNVEDGKCLAIAVLSGHKDIVDILLKNNAQIDTKFLDNYTLLHMAAVRGYTEVVKSLINFGADVNAVTTKRATPLYLAAREGFEEVVEIFIANRANVNFISDDGTPLHKAAEYGHDSVVEVLLNNGGNISVKDYDNRTALELAVSYGHLEIVKMILQCKKVDMNIKGNDDLTLLHIASHENNLEMVKYLIAEGSDINAGNTKGSRPIHIAAREGHKDIVELFLSKGLSINVLGSGNQTLLHYAAMGGQLEVAKYLISKGADVNAQDTAGLYPVHLAALFGHKNVLEVLLENGAIYDGEDKLNRKPFQRATDTNVINLLKWTGRLFQAVKGNNSSEVSMCIEAGGIINAKNADGVTPIHHASWKGYDKVVDVLLQNKANANAVIKNGITPLHYAAKFSHLKIAKSLLSNGAVYNAVTDSGTTPSDIAVDKNISSLFELVTKSFHNIKNDNPRIINDLNRIKDINTLKAIMSARNKEGETLVVAAVKSKFSKLGQLKEISQGDVSSQIGVALGLLSQHNFEMAISILKSAFEKRRTLLGPDNPATLEIQVHIARALYGQGSNQEALNASEEVFKKQKEVLGVNAKDTLTTRSLIAFLLHKQGKDEEAITIFREVVQKQKETLGLSHSDTLETQFHMAIALDKVGNYEEALNINRTVYEKRTEMSGPKNPCTVCAQNNIAMVLSNQGKFEEALKIYKEVYEKKKVIFGTSHRDTLRTLHNIAGVFCNQKNYCEALKTHQQALNVQRKALGPNHPDTLITQCSMANVLFMQRKMIAALKAYKEVLEQSKTVLGLNHPIVLDIFRNIEMINMTFKIAGREESEILKNLEKDINIAANEGDTQTVLGLLKDGADVNDKDVDGRTPLHYAVSSRHIDIINILLKAGADVTHLTIKGNTPLHTATSKGHKDIVKLLLQHVRRDKLNDFVNAKTAAGGTTALHVGAKNGYLDIVKTLLQNGAIFEIKNNEMKTPLDLCIDKKITNLLKSAEGLFKDAKNGNVEIISKLKSLKPDEFSVMTNTRNNQGNTLLQIVVINKHKNIASKFLEILMNA